MAESSASEPGAGGQGIEDVDPEELQEWLQSLDDAVEARGTSRAQSLLAAVLERARDHGIHVPGALTTDYVNTIPPQQEPELPGDQDIERRILARSEEHTSELQSRFDLVCRLLLEKKKIKYIH